MQVHDISTFMTWWVDQVIRIFTYCYQLLDSIQFGGTSMLGVIIGIILLGSGIPVILTLTFNQAFTNIGTSERTKNGNKVIKSRKWEKVSYRKVNPKIEQNKMIGSGE